MRNDHVHEHHNGFDPGMPRHSLHTAVGAPVAHLQQSRPNDLVQMFIIYQAVRKDDIEPFCQIELKKIQEDSDLVEVGERFFFELLVALQPSSAFST